MQAKDIMTAPVVTVTADTSIEDIVRVLWGRRISGVPVVDDADRLIGIVSEDDLMRREELGTQRSASAWMARFSDSVALARSFIKSHGHCARDVMSSPVVSVKEDTPLGEIVSVLERHRIKRVVVTDGRRPVGIVTRSNMLSGLVSKAEQAVAVRPTDRSIKESVLSAVNQQPWVSHGCLNVFVDFGRVELWGWVDSKEEHEALQLAIERIPGVEAVEDHLAMVPPYMRGDGG